MKERPILFSQPMVRAILAGTKTQTRRVVKPQPTHFNPAGVPRRARPDAPSSDVIRCPYGQPGDRLWVKETTIKVEDYGYTGPCYVESDEGWAALEYGLSPSPDDCTEVEPQDIRKRPAIHMPRTMSRILLEITAVCVEPLQDISEADAIAEGVHPGGFYLPCDDTSAFSRIGHECNASLPVARYAALWESINGVGAWEKNPLVWVIEFRRLTT